MYKNYVFDCGQVLVRFAPMEIVRCYLTDEDEVLQVHNALFGRPTPWEALDENKISVNDAKDYLRQKLPERLAKAACDILDNWMFNLPPICGGKELVGKLKERGSKVYLISNINMTFADRCMEVPCLAAIFGQFDGLVFSAKESLVKPDIKIFDRLIERYSIDPRESIFIDDSPANIAGGKAVGFNTYLFDGDMTKLGRFLLEEN